MARAAARRTGRLRRLRPRPVAPPAARRRPVRCAGRAAGARTGAGPRRSPQERIVLWNGGIWNWLDAPTAIRAVAMLDGVRLVFMGAAARGHADRATAEARALAGERVTLPRRVGSLRAASELAARRRLCGLHPPRPPRDAFRVPDAAARLHLGRTADRLHARRRAGRPRRARRLGAVVDPGDHEGRGRGDRVLARGREAYRPAFERARAELAWERAAAPLVRWVTEGGATKRAGGGTMARRVRDLGFRVALRANGAGGRCRAALAARRSRSRSSSSTTARAASCSTVSPTSTWRARRDRVGADRGRERERR